MSENIFRKKSLERIQSPESLNDYVRVTNPGIWLMLVAVIVLLAGACIWGTFGYLDETVKCSLRVENGLAVVSVPIDCEIETGMSVRANDAEGVIGQIDVSPYLGNFYQAEAKIDLPDGSYSCEIVLERVHPISFVLN